MDQAAVVAELEPVPCITRELHIHGYTREDNPRSNLAVYGSDANRVAALCAQNAEWGALLHPELDVQAGEVVWAVREEAARTVEDFLGRRSRALFLNAHAAVEMAPKVASLMAAELGRDTSWVDAQVQAVTDLAQKYYMIR